MEEPYNKEKINLIEEEEEEQVKKAHKKLFDQQVKTLIKNSYPQAADMTEDQFLEYIKPLREKISKIAKVENGYIPFLIVIPKQFVSISKQMSLVKLYDKSGLIELDHNTLQNARRVKILNTPYLIFDVEDGALRQNISPKTCRRQFAKEGRYGLTVEEGIALVTHFPQILENHFIDLPGSHCGFPDSHSAGVPHLWLTTKNGPKVACGPADNRSQFWGSASCGSRG